MRCPGCHRRLARGARCRQHPELTPPGPEATPAPPALPGYALGAWLGGGGFAGVWAARREVDGAEVAIKLALVPGDPRFAREAAALRQLGPPLSPALLGEGTTAERRPYLVLERLDGEPLDAWMATRPDGRAAPGDALVVARALAATVDAMHATGLVHRDLKPENVFLRPDGRATLLDLGLARDEARPGDGDDGDDARAALTRTGARLGTAHYMAPEQCLARRDLDRRADLYAVGVIVYELLAGRPPFVGDEAQVLQAHVSRRPPPLGGTLGLPAALDEPLRRALAKEPAQRPATAAALVEAVAAVFAPAQITPSRTPPRSEAAPARAGGERSARCPVPLLSVRTRAPVRRVLDAVASEQGELVRADGPALLLAFARTPLSSAGARAVVRAAERVAEFAERCVVHVAELRVRDGARGTTLLGEAVTRPETWATPPPGEERVLLTTAAAALLGDGGAVPVGDGGFHAPRPPDLHSAETVAGAVALRGRDALLATLAGEVRAALAERAPILATVVGERGHGKTRVLAALVERVSGAGRRVVRLAARPPEDAGAATLSAQLLAVMLELPARPDAEAVRAACAPLGEAAASWPAVALALGALAAGDPAVATLAAAPGALRQAQAAALAAALGAAAARAPLVVLVDDAGWADFAALDALELATMAGAPRPVAVVVTAYPDFQRRRQGWGDRAARLARHELAPLEADAAAKLLLDLLHPVEYVPEPVLARALELTAGVPLFLAELAIAMRSGGALRRLRGTDSWYVAADDLLALSATPLTERLGARALAGLPPALAELARLCAVLGQSFTSDEVDAVLTALGAAAGAGADLDAQVAMTRLARHGLLHGTRGAGAGAFSWRQPLLREAIEAGVEAATRRRLHEAAFRALSRRAPGARSARLARHAAAAGLRDEARAIHAELAAAAAARHDYVGAEQHYSAALDAADAGDDAGRQTLLAGRGRMRYRIRRLADARDDVGAALALAERLGDRPAVAELLLELATILDWEQDFTGAATQVARAAPLVRELGDPHLAARLAQAEGLGHWRGERVAESLAASRAAADAARALGDYETLVLALVLLGPALVTAGDLDEAERVLGEAIAMAEQAGDRLHLGSAIGNRIFLWQQRGDFERAAADARRCMVLAREVGNAHLERVAQYNLAELLGWLGRADEGLPGARRARELQLRFYEHPGPEDALLVGRLLVAAGRPDDAEARAMLAWLEAHCPAEKDPPSMRVLRRMIELAGAAGFDAGAWDAVCADSAKSSLTDERLEVLHAAVAAARRAGAHVWADACLAGPVAAAAAQSPMWAARFRALAIT